ncbi:MAG: choline dehydrogenase-like flavoprotein [Oleispira sp.]|jgi:choline dehydrogenase-like flavoprotein
MANKVYEEVRGITDPILEGINNGWLTLNAGDYTEDTTLEADVAIIGTGAGGGTTAEILAKAGLKVILIEEGPLKSSNDFNMDERQAYKDLYQENAGRMNKDGSMSILQGRCVGGTTVINWTSSFRTPEPTLQYWADNFDTKGASKEEMAPWFDKMEERLNISLWALPANENNAVLSRGADKLGVPWQIIPRNVKGCWDLGFCGMGCPTNAKQSMLVTTIPSAMDDGSQLLYSARAERLIMDNDKVTGIEVTALDKGYRPTGVKLTVKATTVVLAAGGINGPAMMLRSGAPDPKGLIGKRTFLHPTSFSFASFEQDINAYYGAPQSLYSDHFQWDSVSGPVGYKLEVPPLHPGLTSVLLMGHGEEQFDEINKLPNLNSMISLLRDGFHDDSEGGSIELASDGSAIVDYPINDYLWEGMKRSHLTMSELQFAAGAKAVRPAHTEAKWETSWEDSKAAINKLSYSASRALVGSAHVMGGMAMGENLDRCVVDSNGKYHYLDNLYVIDGSVFPTSIGANPQLSIYGMACKQATKLAEKLTGLS